MFENSDDRAQRLREAKIPALKQMAQDAVPFILAQQPGRLAKFEATWRAHITAWSFDCTRWGDFLCIKFNKLQPWFNYWSFNGEISSVVINLSALPIANLQVGNAPGLGGRDKIVCCFRDEAGTKVEFRSNHCQLPPEMPHGFSIGTIYGEHDLLEIKGIAKPYWPDAIVFSGGKDVPDHTIYAPFGLGKEVLQRILTAVKDGQPGK